MGTEHQVQQDRGTLPIRMTGANILLITSPDDGLHVRNSDNDITYEYDIVRGKWLSVETTALQWGSNGITDNQYLGFGGEMSNGGSGAYMPLDAAIIRGSGISSGGLATKGFDIEINGVLDTSIAFVANAYIDNTLDIDVDTTEFVNIFCQSAGLNIQNPSITLWAKWRL